MLTVHQRDILAALIINSSIQLPSKEQLKNITKGYMDVRESIEEICIEFERSETDEEIGKLFDEIMGNPIEELSKL